MDCEVSDAVCFALWRNRQDLCSKFGIQAQISGDGLVKCVTKSISQEAEVKQGCLIHKVDVTKAKMKSMQGEVYNASAAYQRGCLIEVQTIGMTVWWLAVCLQRTHCTSR